MSQRTILCFGDSNTHGTIPMAHVDDLGRRGPDKRWPGLMAAALGEGWSVIEEGHPGRTTTLDDPVDGSYKNGLTMLPSLLETHRPIDLVIVMLGTNDLKARFGVTPGDIARCAGRLLTVIATSTAGPGGAAPAMLLVCPTPILEAGILAEMFAGGAEKSKAIAHRFEDIAHGMGVPFLDAGAVAEVDPLDGVHLTEASHVDLAAAITKAVLAQLT